MNTSERESSFMPKQALPTTPQLYDELVGDSMESLATASLAHIFLPSIYEYKIHDNGCGAGASTKAIVKYMIDHTAPGELEASNTLIWGTDIDAKALEVCKSRRDEPGWPVIAMEMDASRLVFSDNFFHWSIGSALLFVLPNDGVDALKEMHRTLSCDGGILLVNSWHHIPTMKPLQTAAKLTRPEGTPLPRQGMHKWSAPEFVQDVVERGGFEKSNITMAKADVICTTPELTRFATLLWSFVGGTSEVGWLKTDEENWDKAIELIKEGLKKTDGYKELDGGRAQLKFVANVAVATKWA